MTSLSVASLELADGDILEVSADEVFVDEFTVVLMSPNQFEEFKRRFDTHTKDEPLAASRIIRLTKNKRQGAFEGVPTGIWFLAYTDGEAANVRLKQRTRGIVRGGFG